MNHAGKAFAAISAGVLISGGVALAQQSSAPRAARAPCPCCQAMMQGGSMMQGGQTMGSQMMGGRMMQGGPMASDPSRQAPRPAAPAGEPRR